MDKDDKEPGRLCKKKLIKKKFLEAYKKTSLNRIKVSDLIVVCGISRGAFYFHFDDVYDLYNECEKDMINFLEEGLPDINLVTLLRDRDKHLEVYSEYLSKYTGKKDLLKCFLNGSEESSFRRAWFDSIYRNFEHTLEFLSYPPSSKRKQLLLFFSGGILSLLSDWVLTECKEPVEEIASIHEQVLYQGILLLKSGNTLIK